MKPKPVLNLCVGLDVIHFGLTQKQKGEFRKKQIKKQEQQDQQKHFASSTLT